MVKKYKITDLFTGEEKDLEKTLYPGEPTQAWIEGWTASSQYGWGKIENPYAPTTNEYHEWLDGWESAERD